MIKALALFGVFTGASAYTQEALADQVISQLGADVDLVDATGARTIAAAGINAIHRMSYADCFAVATALEFRVPLITSDPEIIRANVPGLEVIDLRGA